MTTMRGGHIVLALILVVALSGGVAAAVVDQMHAPLGDPEVAEVDGASEQPGLPPFLNGDAELPPGLVKREVLPPGLAKKLGDNTPPGLAKKGEDWLPPGLAKKDELPPGHLKRHGDDDDSDDDDIGG